MTLERTALEFFDTHPEEKASVIKAFYAYHEENFRNNPKAHYFLSSLRSSKCHFCGRRREDVRWDNMSPHCKKRPPNAFPDIGETITAEEIKANAIYKKAKACIPRLLKKLGMSGETLAKLHHTYGYNPETVSEVVNIPPEIIEAYNASMEKERQRSRKALVREVISSN